MGQRVELVAHGLAHDRHEVRLRQPSDLPHRDDAAGPQLLRRHRPDAPQALDRERVLLPALEAALQRPEAGTLDAGSEDESRLTRRLRDALHRALAQLQSGQVLLASVGSTAPFVGLFGTVWGIYHALVGLSAGGSISLDKVTGPVGEALIMTAAGLAVAIPAVLAYNWFGRVIGRIEAELEGFARDLREMLK